ncbi:Transposase family tnp2 [Ceratobasidium sp. AG-Ba]|nr:Transposase family tnp2 [Ceratobasidium sp. AG-Ba]
MDSDHSSSNSENSDDEMSYEYATDLAEPASTTDDRVLCTCGCNKYWTIRTVYRHLERQQKARYISESSDTVETSGDGSLFGEGEDMEDDVPGIGTCKEAGEQDLPMHHNEEEDYMPDPESPVGWDDIPTPPPSPPPLQLDKNDAASDEEDGYENITAEDYREYDRWFAEDRQEELDEFLNETIAEEELDSIKMMAIRQFGHISVRNYERIRYSFRDKVFLMTLQRLGTRIARLSGIKPEIYHCCVKVCHAFTGGFADEERCSTCREPRYDKLGRPRQVFQYIPTIGRFLAMFNNPEFVKKLEYRYNYVQHEGRINDFFDSQLYKKLCQQNIVVEGEDLGVKYFSGKYDIATTLLADGVQIFKQETATCWPIMLQILNLPPRERSQIRNVIPLCVIPGPNQPKNFNSFLEPFVLECLTFARGVTAFNSRTGHDFTLRHHPVLVGGDMQAIKHLEEMKGVGAKVPCRGCESVAVYHSDKRTYYIPLAEPLVSDNPAATTSSYDPLNLPNRTEERMKRQAEKMDKATPREYEELAKRYGIAGPTILDRIPSLQRPTSYPHEFLHLFLLNHVPDLITLWIGKHPSVTTAGCENYLISKADWEAIGRETEAATKLIPSYFSRKLPNIQIEWRLFCGESWSFWVLYIGPIVLRERLGKKYYNHFMELVSIIKCLIQFENTTERIEQLRTEIAGYVERYEEYYYQYNYDRVCVCKLTLHALLHVAEEVIRCGPIWVFWSYLTERYCREIIACARQRAVPFITVMKFVLQMSQLTSVSMRFHEVRKALLFGKSDAPVNQSAMERVYSDYPDTILRFPCLAGFSMQPNVRRRVAAFLKTNSKAKRTHHEWMQYLPKHCERWGKLRIGDGGDCIRCACARNPSSAQGNRDNSFVKYEFDEDLNTRFAHEKVDMVKRIGYGRLDFILAITLHPDPEFDIESPQLHILAQITKAKDANRDASAELVSYTKFGRTFILDVTSIKCAVGRVETKAVKRGGEWVIIDRDDSLCRTAFTQEDQEFEDD